MGELNKGLLAFLFLCVFFLGVLTAFVRLEIVNLNTKRSILIQKLEREEFKRRALYLELSEKSEFKQLSQKASKLRLEHSY